MLESALSACQEIPDLSPWPTPLGLLALARVRAEFGDRANTRALLGEARTIVEAYPDAGMFSDLLEHLERELGKRRQSEPMLDGELTDRELAAYRPPRRSRASACRTAWSRSSRCRIAFTSSRCCGP